MGFPSERLFFSVGIRKVQFAESIPQATVKELGTFEFPLDQRKEMLLILEERRTDKISVDPYFERGFENRRVAG